MVRKWHKGSKLGNGGVVGLTKQLGANGQGSGDRDSGMEVRSSEVPLGSFRASCHDQSFVFPDIPSCREKTEKEQNIQLSHFN